MKITNDLNNNSDFLSLSNNVEENSSLLGSLFSININSNEVKSNSITDDFEFVFKKEDIEIIDYISNIIPNLNINNLGLADFKKIKSEIQADQNIKTELKDKLLSLLDKPKRFNKNFFIKLPEYYKFKSSKNKNIDDYKGNAKNINESLKSLAYFMKNKEKAVEQSEKTSFKSNIINKNSNEVIKFEHELDNQTRSDSNNKKLNFVKKIKKNDHPNKLYQLSKSNSFTFKEKHGVASQ